MICTRIPDSALAMYDGPERSDLMEIEVVLHRLTRARGLIKCNE